MSEQRITISGERDLLSRHLDWIAAQDWCDEFYSEVRTLVSQLKAANGRQDPKPVGRCPDLITGSDCGGPIWVDEAAGHAHCGLCQRTWDGHELHRLSIILENAKRPVTEDGRDMETAAEIAERHKVKPHTVSKTWAHRLGVRSVNGYYDPEWFARDTPSVAS